MPEPRTLTGHTVAMVKLAEPAGAEAIVRRGETLPDNLATGELERLQKAGAFDEPPTADLAGQGAVPAFARVPEVRTAATALPPRGDTVLPLPPQVTLAANPEPDGGVAKVTDEPAKETAARRSGQR